MLNEYTGSDTDVVIPDGVVVIKTEAFSNLPISSLRLPNTVKEIETCAFSECGHLKTVTIEDGFCAKGFRVGAFYKCGKIERFDIQGKLGSGVDLFLANCCAKIIFHDQTTYDFYASRIADRASRVKKAQERIARLTAEKEKLKGRQILKKMEISSEIERLRNTVNSKPNYPELVLER